MKKYYFLVVTVLMLSCNSSERPQLFEHYKVGTARFSEKVKYLFQGVMYYTAGSEIYLNNDHTFKYLTCGNIITGTWKRVDDQVWLTTLTNKYRIDSLNKTWPKMGIGNAPMIFNISKSSLTKIRKDGVSKTIEILTKLE